MTHTLADNTVATIDSMVASYVSDLKQLPSSSRLSEASQGAVYAMACALLHAGQLQQADAYLSFLLLYAPTHPDYLCAKAHCARQNADPMQAVNLLSLALYVKPGSCAIALALAEALIEADAPTVAREILQLVSKLAQLPADMMEHTRAELLLQGLHVCA